MQESKMSVPEYIQQLYWNTLKWPTQTNATLDLAQEKLENSKVMLLDKIEDEIGFIDESIETIANELEYFDTLDSSDMHPQAMIKVAQLSELVLSTQNLQKSVQSREEALGFPPSTFADFEDCVQIFQSYEQLWKLVADVRSNIKTWVNDWFVNLNGELMKAKIQEWNDIIKSSEDYFDLDTISRDIIIKIKQEVDDFWRNSSVIAALRNPALKDLHWNQLKEIIGVSIQDLQNLRLYQILELDLELVQSVIADISLEANYIFKIESELEKMKSELSNIEFEIENVKEADKNYIVNFDIVKSILEDQLIRCEQKQAQITDQDWRTKFEKWILSIQKGLEMLNNIRELEGFHRLYYPIIHASTTTNLITKEAEEAFISISKTYKIVSEIFAKNKKGITLILRNDLCDLVSGYRSRIDVVKEGIEKYLREMQNIFPRMYLVNEKVLIDTLSCLNPQQLSKMLAKYFPPCYQFNQGAEVLGQDQFLEPSPPKDSPKNIRPGRGMMNRTNAFKDGGDKGKVVFDKININFQKSTALTGITSHEGEVLTFIEPVKFTGNITKELKSTEECIYACLKSSFNLAYNHIQENEPTFFKELVKYPHQIVMLATRIKWMETLNNEKKIGSKQGMGEFNAKICDFIGVLVQRLAQNLTINEKLKIEGIITTLSYFLSSSDIDSETSEFVQYFINDDSIKLSIDHLTPIDYGFEYLGHESNMVITNTMLKSVKRLFQTFELNRGVIFTEFGLTESASMMSELITLTAIAHQPLDMKITSFEKLESVLKGSIYLPTILIEIQNLENIEASTKLFHQFIEEVTKFRKLLVTQSHTFRLPLLISIDNVVGVRNLPTKLRHHFRVVGINQPNLQETIEATLLNRGFKNHKQIRKKLMIFLKNRDSILKASCNFNHLKIIVNIASEFRAQSSSNNELSHFRNAILFYYKQELKFAEVANLKEILSNIFKVSADEQISTSLANGTFLEVAQSLNFAQTDYFFQKCVALFKLVEINCRVMLLGDPLCGKTSLWRTTLKIIDSMTHKDTSIKPFHVFPNVYSEEFYKKNLASFTPFGNSIISARKHAIQMEDLNINESNMICSYSWIIFDGAIEDQWLDLSRNYNMEFSSKYEEENLLQFIYETSDISTVSPALLSDVNIILLETRLLKAQYIISNLINTSSAEIKVFHNLIQTLYLSIAIPAIKYMQNIDCIPTLRHTERIIIIRIFQMFFCLFRDKGLSGYERMTSKEQYMWTIFLFIFCVVWVVGADSSKQSRLKFDSFLKDYLVVNVKLYDELMADSSPPVEFSRGTFSFPEDVTVFDYFVDDKLIQWKRWNLLDSLQKDVKAGGIAFNIIPTEEMISVAYQSKLYFRYNYPILVCGKLGVGVTTNSYLVSGICTQTNRKSVNSEIIQTYTPIGSNGSEFKNTIEANFPRKRYNARGTINGKANIVFIHDLQNCFSSSESQANCTLESLRMGYTTGKWASSSGVYDELENLKLVASFRSRREKNEFSGRWARIFMPITIDDDQRSKLYNITYELFLTRLSSTLTSADASKVIDVTYTIFSKLKDTFKPSSENPHHLFLLKDCILIFKAIAEFPITNYRLKEFYSQWIHSMRLIFGSRLEDSNKLETLIRNQLQEKFDADIHESFYDQTYYVQPDTLLPDPSNKADYQISEFSLMIKSINLMALLSEIDRKRISNSDSMRLLCTTSFIIKNCSSNMIMAGEECGNRKSVTLLAAKLTKKVFLSYEPNISTYSWAQFLEMIKKELSQRNSVLVYVIGDILEAAQWIAIISMMKIGVPYFRSLVGEQTGKLQHRIKFVISFSSKSIMNESIHKFPGLLSSATTNISRSLSDEAILQYINQSLTVRPVRYDPNSIVNYMQWCYNDIKDYSKKDPTITCAPNYSIYNALEAQKRIYTLWEDNIIEKIDLIMKSISNLDRSAEIITRTKLENEKNFTSVKSRNDETQKLLNLLEFERAVAEDIQENIKKETELLARNHDEVSFLDTFLKAEIEKHKLEITEISQRLNSLSRGDIYDLKGISDPSESVKSILEATMLLLKFEMKPGESGWEGSKRMISEKNFVNSLIIAMGENYSITPVILHTVLRIRKSDIINLKELNNTAIILKEWAEAVTNHQSTKFALIPKQKLLQETQTKIIYRDTTILEYQQELLEHEKKMTSFRLEYCSMVQRNEIAGIRAKEIEKKLLLSNDLENSLKSLKENLQKSLASLTKKRSLLLSNSIIAACRMCFLNRNSHDTKERITDRWIEQASNFNLEESLDFNINEFLDPYGKNDSTESEHMLEVILSLRFIQVYPILIDPFSIIQSLLLKQESSTKTTVISITNDELESIIKLGHKIPQLLIIKVNSQIELKLIPGITQLLNKFKFQPNPQVSLRIYFLVNYFVENRLIECLGLGYMSFNVDYEVNHLSEVLKTLICAEHNPDLKFKSVSKNGELKSCIIKRELMADRVIVFCQTLNAEEIFSNDVIKSVIDIQSQQDSAISKVTILDRALISLNQEMLNYTTISNALSQIFLVFHSMHKISEYYFYSFDDFVGICIDKIAIFGAQASSFEAKRYCAGVYKAVYLNVTPGYLTHDRIVLSFLLAQKICEIPIFEKSYELLMSEDHLRFFFSGNFPKEKQNSFNQPSSLKNTSRLWMSDAKWDAILQLSKMQEFQKFAVDFSKYGNRATTSITEHSWQDIFESKDPAKAPFPLRWLKALSQSERLLVTNIIRPDSMGDLLLDISKSVLGSLLEAGFPASNILQRYRFSSSSRSITVINNSFSDAVRSVIDLAFRLSMEFEPLIITTSTLEIDKLIIDAILLGRWILIDFISENFEAEIVFQRLSKLQSEQMNHHSMFRVWYICKSNFIFPVELSRTTLKVYLENDQDFRCIFGDAMSILYRKADYIRQSRNTDLRTKLFNICVLFSILKFRMHTPPFVTEHFLYLPMMDLEHSLSCLITKFEESDTSDKKTSDYWFEEIFMKSWGSQLTSDSDYKWCQSMFFGFYNIEWPSRDDYNRNDKLALLPPLSEVYELYCADEFHSVFEQINRIPRGSDINLLTFGYSENIDMFLNGKGRTRIIESISICRPDLQIKKRDAPFEDLINALEIFQTKLKTEKKFSWFTSADLKVSRPQGPRGVKPAPKIFESYSRANFQKYRLMTAFVIESVDSLIERLNGNELLQPKDIDILTDILHDKIPEYWNKSGLFYETYLPFKKFTNDFLARLAYTRQWHASKFKGNSSDGMIYYDFSKLFDPSEFFTGIIVLTSSSP
jgi:hypothetical protein